MLPNQSVLLIWMFVLMTAIIVLFSTQQFNFLDKDVKYRNEQIDGLRFFLSIFVVFHHYVLSESYFFGSGWTYDAIKEYPVNQVIGRYGVSLFFMISGFLFCNIKSSARDWFVFYIKRFFRIAPLFTLSSCVCISLAFFLSQNPSTSDISLKSLAYWFNMGLSMAKPDIFSLQNSSLINASVTWTLYWEWGFYFSLPFVLFLKSKWCGLSLSISIIFLCVFIYADINSFNATLISFFSIGFLCAELTKIISLSVRTCNVLIVFGGVFCIFIVDDPYTIFSIPGVGLIFFAISMGGDFFGLLKMKGVRRLGEITYSTYMLHGIFLYVLNFFISPNISKQTYMLLSSFTILLILIISSFTFYVIEAPLNKLGSQIATRMLKTHLKSH
ncbi:acyltransferase family protein [Escherichia coli]